MRRVQQVNAQNAIVIRDTPDKLLLASKIIRDIDKAKPEVLVHVQVLTASVDRLRDLGILPGQRCSLTFTPVCSNQPTTAAAPLRARQSSTSGTPATPPQIALNSLKNLSTADYSLTLPGATANAILTDNNTKIIQDPEVRVSDGEKATLKSETASPWPPAAFRQASEWGQARSNPLVNTQFQYIDVGVNIEVTPRVHPDGDVSMKLSIEVSQITGTSNIGGINQPVISQRKIEHDIRLEDGEVSVLGGLIERDTDEERQRHSRCRTDSAFPISLLDNSNEVKEDEVLIVLTPHVLRLPSITADNLRTLAAGTDTDARVYRDERGDGSRASDSRWPFHIRPSRPVPPAGATPAAQLHFDPPARP